LFSENTIIYNDGEFSVSQDIKRSFGGWREEKRQDERIICSDCEFPDYLGDMYIRPYTSTALLAEHIGLNTESINWRNSAVFTFGDISNSTVSWTIVNRNNVSIFSQPSIESETLIIVDAGFSTNAYPQQPIKQVENETCTMWYRVNFTGHSYGYIKSRYLEPVEIEVKQ
jgi:hypothetical protein